MCIKLQEFYCVSISCSRPGLSLRVTICYFQVNDKFGPYSTDVYQDSRILLWLHQLVRTGIIIRWPPFIIRKLMTSLGHTQLTCIKILEFYCGSISWSGPGLSLDVIICYLQVNDKFGPYSTDVCTKIQEFYCCFISWSRPGFIIRCGHLLFAS